MATRNEAPIASSDVEAYLAGTSDFAFEMAVRLGLQEAGFSCFHGGTYTDPVTEKIRSYDFRARREVSEGTHVLLAVECKNIRVSGPLLVYATMRIFQEAFHSLLCVERLRGICFATAHSRNGHLSIYPPGGPVGRSTDQVARYSDGGFKQSNDSATYAKLLQALQSTEGLVREAAATPHSGKSLFVILPVLVIPDGLLWQVEYAEDGARIHGPSQVSHTTLLYQHTWNVPTSTGSVSYIVSHLEIVTLGALVSRLRELADENGLFRDTSELLKQG